VPRQDNITAMDTKNGFDITWTRFVINTIRLSMALAHPAPVFLVCLWIGCGAILNVATAPMAALGEVFVSIFGFLMASLLTWIIFRIVLSVKRK